MRGFTYLEDQDWIDREMTRGSDLPISLTQARKVTDWLKRNYGAKIEAATKDTPFPPYIICALTCQETAYAWIKMADTLSADEVLARCVYDASGETSSDPRSAFPHNTSAFRAKYGDELTDMLIEEANKTRKMRGMGPKDWVYKGYGIFQYDLQAVTDDKEFFAAKQWYDIDACLLRAMQELKQKWARTHDLWASVKAYNGSGPRADQYRRNVQQFADVTKEVWATTPMPEPAPAPSPPAAPAPAPAVVPSTPPPVEVAAGSSAPPQAAPQPQPSPATTAPASTPPPATPAAGPPPTIAPSPPAGLAAPPSLTPSLPQQPALASAPAPVPAAAAAAAQPPSSAPQLPVQETPTV